MCGMVKIFLLLLGAKAFPAKRMSGLVSRCSATAVRKRAAPPTGSVSPLSTLTKSEKCRMVMVSACAPGIFRRVSEAACALGIQCILK